MAAITVILPSYQNYTLELPRDKLLPMFPQSLIATAMEYPGPVEILNPLITPEILQAVQTILTQGRIPSLNFDTTAAADYLQMDPILLASEPKLSLFETIYPDVDLLAMQTSDVEAILIFIAWNSAPKLLRYILRYLTPGEKLVELGNALIVAVGEVDPETVRLLLTRVNPGNLHPNPLIRAVTGNRVNNIKLLLADDRTTLDFGNTDLVQSIFGANAFEAMQLIIQDRRFDLHAATLDLPERLDKPAYIRLLLQRGVDIDRPEVIAGLADTLSLHTRVNFINPNAEQSAHILVYTHRTNPNTFLRYFFETPQSINPNILADWLKEPRLNLESLGDGLLLSLIYLTPPDVLKELIPRLPYTPLIRLSQLANHPELYPEPKYSPIPIRILLQSRVNPDDVPNTLTLEPDLDETLRNRAGPIYEMNQMLSVLDHAWVRSNN